MTWRALMGRRYRVAHEEEDGRVVLDFGKHRGAALDEVPAEYLTWLARGGGKALLPAELLALAEDELRARERKPEKITCPDRWPGRRRPPPATWATWSATCARWP